MRKLGLPWIVMCVAVLGLVLGGCAGKDGKNGAGGIAGTNGTNGTNGTDGINGIDGTGVADCQPCHSDTATFAVRPAFAQWRHSAHASEALLWGRQTGGATSWCRVMPRQRRLRQRRPRHARGRRDADLDRLLYLPRPAPRNKNPRSGRRPPPTR